MVADNLNSPQGLLVTPDGSVWVADSGTGGETTFSGPAPGGTPGEGNYGDTARVLRVAPGGSLSVVATMPSITAPGLEPTGGGKLAFVGGSIFLTNGVWNANYSVARVPKASSVLRVDGGEAVEVADVYGFEADANPDGVPTDQGGIDSHAYGLAAGPDGQLYVADAGGNSLLRVDPATGTVGLVAALQGRTPATGVQSVPTGVAVGPDGSAYVALLSGFPFPDGAARVVRVADGAVTDFATGLTALVDAAFGPDGRLYVVSFSRADPEAAPPYLPNTGAVLRLGADGEPQTVLSGLNYPTAIAFNEAGDAYVAEDGLQLGSGRVLRYEALTRSPAQ